MRPFLFFGSSVGLLAIFAPAAPILLNILVSVIVAVTLEGVIPDKLPWQPDEEEVEASTDRSADVMVGFNQDDDEDEEDHVDPITAGFKY